VKPTSKNEKPATKPNKPSKSEKPAKTASKPVKTQKQSVKGSGSEPDSSGKCYRPTSSYGKLFALLLQHKEKGIRRSDLVKEGMKVCQKPEKNILFDVAVVVSPAKDGSAHRSANNAADHYWVERLEDGLLKLHLR
jgi:hypothetical protein